MIDLILLLFATVAIIWKNLNDGRLAESLLARQHITLIVLLNLFQALIATLLTLLHGARDACR